MFNKKIIAIVLILLFTLAVLPSNFAEDKDYSILNSDITLVINENGLLEVRETYTYDFDGEFHGVYRDIPLKSGQKISDLKVYTENAYASFTHETKDGKEHIVVHLYSDEAKTQPVRNTQVKVTYTYSFSNVINIYDDIAELQFQFWGKEWDKPVENTHTHVQLKSSDGVKYWINPYKLSYTDSWNDNTLEISTGHISDYGEVRLLIPLDQFDDNPVFGNRIHENGISKITDIQDEYKSSAEFEDQVFTIIPIILLISLIIPVAIYFKKGREPKIEYNGIYERELPTEDGPMFVDALYSSENGIGNPSKNGYQATIMDLINRKYLILNKDKDNLEIEVNGSKNLANLETFEIDIVNLLKRYSGHDKINLNKLKSNLTSESYAKGFIKDYNLVLKDFKQMFVKPVIRNYFSNDGAVWIKVYNVIMVLVSFILIGCALAFDSSILILIFFIIFAVVNIGLAVALPNYVGGSWSYEGYTNYKKWKNFKKFLNDYSLISENPPESIAVWNDYLVYATALGEAKTVLKAMEKFVPEDVYMDNDLYFYHSYGGYYAISHSLNNAHAAVDSNSGFGGAGGGSGGGGGGAF